MAKIIFLGTGGDKSVIGRQIRGSGGIILQTGGLQLHIDPGPGALVKAKEFGVNLRANTAILVSHNHIGHCNDVNAVIDAMTLAGLDKKGVLIGNNTVINGAEGYQPFLTGYHKSCLERIIVLGKGHKVGIDRVEIQATQANHSEPGAIGFKFITPNFILGYSADTAYSGGMVESLKGSDVLILNVVFPGEQKAEHHLNRERAGEVIEKVRPKLAIIQHFGFDMLKADPLQEAREIQRKTGIQTIAANDGLVISPSSYAAKSEQQRLGSFEKEG